MNMAYRFRIYPTREQENLLAKTFSRLLPFSV
ncbi:helix-turn-helix domain-containing protein [Eubacterium ramulus]